MNDTNEAACSTYRWQPHAEPVGKVKNLCQVGGDAFPSTAMVLAADLNPTCLDSSNSDWEARIVRVGRVAHWRQVGKGAQVVDPK